MLRALLPPHPLRVRSQPQLHLPLPQEGRRPMVRGIAQVRVLERLLHLQARDRERADHLEREEADDVDGVVPSLEVERGGEVEELLEALRLAVRERRLPAVRVVLVLLARHLPCCVVGLLESQDRSFVCLDVVLVLFVVRRQDVGEHRHDFPGELDRNLLCLRGELLYRWCGVGVRGEGYVSSKRIVRAAATHRLHHPRVSPPSPCLHLPDRPSLSRASVRPSTRGMF